MPVGSSFESAGLYRNIALGQRKQQREGTKEESVGGKEEVGGGGGAEMLAHFGITLPSSLSEFSKSILGGTTAAKEVGLPGNTNGEEDANTPPTLDEDVLLSYYARLADHRPSSRLLKERMFENGNKGPRSATLLVSGSPTFERPWRHVLHVFCILCIRALRFHLF